MELENQLQEWGKICKKNYNLINYISESNKLIWDEIEVCLRKKFPDKIRKIEKHSLYSFPIKGVQIWIDIDVGAGEFSLEELLWIEKNLGFKYLEEVDHDRFIFGFNPTRYQSHQLGDVYKAMDEIKKAM